MIYTYTYIPRFINNELMCNKFGIVHFDTHDTIYLRFYLVIILCRQKEIKFDFVMPAKYLAAF